ncbi:MAG: LptA/OstA family protein [Armatimonadota bacterium]
MAIRIVSIVVILAALCACVALCGAESMAVGKMTLAGRTIELVNQTITVQGDASFTSPTGQVKSGTMCIESMQAESIHVELAKGKGEFNVKEALAEGGVSVKAKRGDLADGKTVVRNVLATAGSARLDSATNTIVLTGNAVVKVFEQGIAEPMAVLTGEKMTVTLNENKIKVEGKPAEINYTKE